jgi:glyoxylase-like metal-dependent hydrolase (beta-lactamase superfamily II)
MMVCADELHRVADGVRVAHAYDPSCKSELWATALRFGDGTWLIDPISFSNEARAEIGHIAGVIVTNENHIRAAHNFDAPIASRVPDIGTIDVDEIPFTTIELPGAPPGEIAIYTPANSGTLVIGDALIHFEPYGFTFLPAKYCTDVKRMRRSLGQLLELQFERILFAHGTPIVAGAHARLAALLKQ